MIPNIIHQFWGGPPIPPAFTQYSHTWQLQHVAWDHKLWTPDNIPYLDNQELWDSAESISKEPWQFRADVLRYEILYRYGGVWIDMDMEPTPGRSLNDLMWGNSAWIAWEETDRWVSNAVMASTPYHPWIRALIEQLPMNVHVSGGNTVKSGPQFITPLTLGRLDVDIYPSSFFYPFAYNKLNRRGTVSGVYGTHHFWNRTKRTDPTFGA